RFGPGLDRDRTDRFVGMYVNDLTLGYGERGRQAVERLMTEAFEKGLIPNPVPVLFAARDITPPLTAYSTTSAVLCRSSFWKMRARWVSTVPGLIDSTSA